LESQEIGDDVSRSAGAHPLLDDWQGKMWCLAREFAFAHVGMPVDVKAEIADYRQAFCA
jgi:hypothetical protein